MRTKSSLIMVWIIVFFLSSSLPFVQGEEEWKAGVLTCAELIEIGGEVEEPIYDPSREVFTGGKVVRIPEGCIEKFKFEDMTLTIEFSKRNNRYIIVQGTGRTDIEEHTGGYLERTQIVSFEGKVEVTDDPNNFYVQGLADLTMDTAEASWSVSLAQLSEEAFLMAEKAEYASRLMISQDSSFKDYISIEDSTTVVLSRLGVECKGCTYYVVGNPSVNFVSWSDTSDNDGVTPSQVFIAGREHTIWGYVQLKDGQLIVEEGSVGMVDGAYVNALTASRPVIFYFGEDGPTSRGENYVYSKSDELEINGQGFSVALGTGRGGYPSDQFPYILDVQSDYLPEEASENSRLLIDVTNGNVRINKEHSFVKSEGEVTVTNGVNQLIYTIDENTGKTAYKYRYIPCEGERNALCTEVPYLLYDGGTVNIKTFSEPMPVAETERVAFFDEDERYRVEYDLNPNKVYALGYKGGQAAQAVAGGLFFDPIKEEEYKQWGHLGLLYFRDDRWWVAESDGANVKIRPVEDSLFANHIDGVFEVQTQTPNAIIQKVEQDFAGKKYTYIGSTKLVSPLGVYCSNFVAESIRAAEDIETPEAPLSAIYMSEESQGLVATTMNLMSSLLYDTPAEVINSPALTPVEPDIGTLVGSETIYGKMVEE